MGDKIEAKKIARQAGVPVVPALMARAISNYQEALQVATEVGYPLLRKASAGGRRRGLRVVQTAETLERDLSEIMSEAESPSVTPRSTSSGT